LLIHGKKGFEAGAEALRKVLGDPCGSVAIVAAESLGRFGDEADREQALDLLLEKADQGKGNVFEAILAVNALDYLDEAAAPRLEAIRKLPRKPGMPAPRTDGYVGSLLKHLTDE
jgi:HEAT repeat protein